ncbi:MAG: hypothetical protein RSC96_05975, partial [Oscillospiraceae bacterium]
MKKKILALTLALALSVSMFAACGGAPASTPAAPTESKPAESKPAETVELTLGSWRTDDVAQMTSLLAE